MRKYPANVVPCGRARLFAATLCLTFGTFAALTDPWVKLASQADWQSALDDGRITPVTAHYDALDALYKGQYPNYVQVPPGLFAYSASQSGALGDGLLMVWGDSTVIDQTAPQVASWQFTYPKDPNLVGTTLSITITPPAWPAPAPLPPAPAAPILGVSLTLNDALGGWVTWAWPVGGVGGLVPGAQTTITIDPVTLFTTPFALPALAPGIGYAAAQTTSIQADELAAGAQFWASFPSVPAVGGNKPWNYWGNLQVIPEPGSAAITAGVVLLGVALGRRFSRRG